MTSRSFVSSPELWSVLLAAGGSKRLGYPKQLLRDPVKPLLLAAVDAALAVTPGKVVVVIGAIITVRKRLVFMLLGDTTTAGRVFFISEPMAGSRLIKQTSNRVSVTKSTHPYQNYYQHQSIAHPPR